MTIKSMLLPPIYFGKFGFDVPVATQVMEPLGILSSYNLREKQGVLLLIVGVCRRRRVSWVWGM